MDIERLAKALDKLDADMERVPPLSEAADAWLATHERVHWLADVASMLADDQKAAA